MRHQERQLLLTFACDAAVAAGGEALPYFRSALTVENKEEAGGFDPVTEADRAVERALRAALASQYPDHGVFGEEFGVTAGNGLTWVIDPIDGTRAFMSGLLHWGVLLGLFDGQQAVLGVCYQPFTQELFWGDGDTAWYRRGAGPAQPLKVRSEASVGDAIVATSWRGFFEGSGRSAGFNALEAEAKLLRHHGDCYLYGLLAMGQLQVVVDGGLSPYDILPLVPIVRGAGGVVVGGEGNEPINGGFVIAAATESLATATAALLHKTD